MKLDVFKNKLHQVNKVETRMRYVNLAMLFAVLVLIVGMGFIMVNDITGRASKELAYFYSLEAVNDFNSYMNRDLAMVQKVAGSKVITDWFADENNPEKRTAVCNEMMEYANLFANAEFYIGIQASLNGYIIDEDKDFNELKPSVSLDRSNPDNDWYYQIFESDKDYIYFIDVDETTHNWRIWIKHKVVSGGKLLGVFCTGLQIDTVLDSMFSHFEESRIMGFVVDNNGIIQLDSNSSEYHTANKGNHIRTAINDSDFDKFIDLYLQRIDGYFRTINRPEIVKLSTGSLLHSSYNYASVAPIENSNWSVVAFYNSNSLFGVGTLLPLICMLIIIFLLYVLLRSIILRRFVFSPLSRLSVSVTSANGKEAAIYGTERTDEIGELARNIQRTWEHIGASQQRIMLLLDATPLACRLMKRTIDGRYELFECNEESVKLFKFKDKQEFMDKYFMIYPKLQPTGKNSLAEGQKLFDEAYEKGRCVAKFCFQTIDGELIPSEVILVRVEYDDEYVIAGYTRDMREHEQMMDDIRSRDRLLNMGNSAVQTLLSTANDNSIEKALIKSLEIVGNSINGDRVQIWRNDTINGEFHFIHTHEWLSNTGKQKPKVFIGLHFPYSAVPKWKNFFTNGGYINGAVSGLSDEEKRLFKDYDIKTIVIIPLFVKDNFWGFFRIDDCKTERIITDDEITILRSVSQMLISALNRNAQAEEIREAHDHVRILLDKMPFACHLWNKNYEMIDCNEANTELFGVTDKDILMTRFADFAPTYQPDGRNSVEAKLEYVKEAFEKGKSVAGEFIHLTSDGQQLPIESTLIRIPYKNDYAVAVYLRDMREQKAMIHEIERKSNLLGNMNQSANILLQSSVSDFEMNLYLCMKMIGEAVDADRMCIWKNSIKNEKLCCTLVYEWASDDRLRTNEDIATEVPYEDNIPTWERLLSKGECINTLTNKLSPIEKARMDMHGIKSIFVAPVFVNNEFWGFVGCDNCHDEKVFSRDVVSVLRSGSLLITHALLRNDMTQNLQKVATELEMALLNTQKANNAKSDFLASMSHEMRTPLNAIIGLSGLCLESKGLDEDTNSNLEKIYNAGDMLLSIVNDILDISKIEAGKMELVEVRYDVPSLINDTVTQNILRIGEKPIQFKLEICTDLFAVLYGDELRVKQIINNLLSNAIKYTDSGTVELSVHCEQEGDIVWVIAKISDTGKGIRPEDLDKLFKDYSQLDLESNRKTEGTGLGLPISKSLAKMMNGTISVESEYGKGSVFTVKLAQKFVSEVHIGEDVVNNLQRFCYSDNKRVRNAKIKHLHMPYARVLVVDDNPTNLDVAKGLMKPYGMQIDCVTDGEQAVDVIRSEKIKYNAVFMDHMMPGIDGIEATRIIREEIGTDYAKNISIIALTVNAISGNEAMFLSKGFQAFISKPIEIGRLDTVIRRYVRDKSQETDNAEYELHSENGPTQHIFENKTISGLNISNGIERFHGDAGAYLNVLRSYVNNTLPLLDKIMSLEKDNLQSYAVHVHGIKGASRSICAEEIGNLAEQLEKEAKAGNHGFVRNNTSVLYDLVDDLINGIKNFLDSMVPDNPKPKKDKPDDDVLKKLLTACENFDTDTIDVLIKELDSYEYESEGSFIAWIIQTANAFKYNEIIEKLTTSFADPKGT